MADDSDLVEVVRATTEPDAHRAVELLLLRGIGASLDGPDPGTAPDAAGGFRVRVVAAEADRARELLGLGPPAAGVAHPPGAVEGRRQQWIVIGFVALGVLAIPIVAFWLAYVVSR